ncbi:MAG: hypothetical protein ACRDQ4_20635 [Pseudonocardiaceae bacterium]
MSHSQLDRAITAPAPVRSVPLLLAELVELGREAWRISERERAIRAEIEDLRESEEYRSSPPDPQTQETTDA